MPLIHKAFDQMQALDLGGWIEALPVSVALGRGESVAAFPHAQHILREAGITLDSGDGEMRSIHIVQDKCQTGY